MSAMATAPWDDMATNAGFTDEDRRRFERMDVRAEDSSKKLDELLGRLRGVETSLVSYATREDLRDVEISVDELRAAKADKSDLSLMAVREHETRLKLLETVFADRQNTIERILNDVEDLKAWRWKEAGAIGVGLLVINILMKVLFK